MFLPPPLAPHPPAVRGVGLRRRSELVKPWTAVLSPLAAQAASDAPRGRLVLVFLRGAYDGLSAFVPWDDPHYARLRPSLALPRPDGTAQTALRLDERFALHPALAPLLPLWQQGVLGVVPAAGLPLAIRSHFEAQHYWEIGQPGKHSAATGWLNTLAQGAAEVGDAAGPRLIGVGEANPEILRGPAPAQLVARGQAATRTGVLANERARQALLDLYAQSGQFGPAFEQGASSRLQTAQILEQAEAARMAQNPAMAATANPDLLAREMQAASNGAGNPAGLQLDARHLATLMRQDRRLQLGFLSAGGWDTHANQGGVTGALAQNLGNLAAALLALRTEFNQTDDVIAVVSEFGRTCAENGTRGTDHGHGNALWLIGNRVQGGRWHGRWEGLAPGQLHEGRDLPVLHDFRAVLSLVLRATQGADDTRLAAVFPGNPWAGQALTSGDNRTLAGLLRA